METVSVEVTYVVDYEIHSPVDDETAIAMAEAMAQRDCSKEFVAAKGELQ